MVSASRYWLGMHAICIAGLIPMAAAAQDAEPAAGAEAITDTATIVAGSVLTSEIGGQTYTPDYFARFAPRNALDMVREIPGFSISGGGDGSRGLGQADQNILINGKRFSSKSESASDQLGRIPADNVIRIEVVDGTKLDIPGLTGQVANIVSASGGLSGQFNYEGAFRTTRVDPELYGGEVSLSGSTGALGFTVALSNNNRRFGSEGRTVITDADGALLQTDDGGKAGALDRPTLSAALGYDFGRETFANLNLSYTRSYFKEELDEFTFGNAAADRNRNVLTAEDGYEYEISGDIAFPLGTGTLKLIGLESFDSENFADTLVDAFVDPDQLSSGGRFTRGSEAGERIGRFEYNFPLWGGDWQLAGEAAFNRLNRVSGLFTLTPDGIFTAIDFPAGTGGVTEDRYEGIVSYSRQLTGKLALQTTAGAEYSRIEQTGSAANARTFQRPKGSVSLAWQPEAGFDISLAAAREVGQLSFGDFLARVFLDDGNANAGNNELVPQQSWGLNFEVNKTLGKWGSTTLSVERDWIEDFIDIIPLAGGGESRGNIASATALDVEWNTTLQLEPVGIAGGKLEIELQYERSRVDDPLTGAPRAFSDQRDRVVDLDYRHDVPGSDWAYGGGYRYTRMQPYFRFSETGKSIEGPSFVDLFLENKDVLGLTVRATYANIFGGREILRRTVFDGPRDEGRILFAENRDRRIGPIFRFSVAGSF